MGRGDAPSTVPSGSANVLFSSRTRRGGGHSADSRALLQALDLIQTASDWIETDGSARSDSTELSGARVIAQGGRVRPFGKEQANVVCIGVRRTRDGDPEVVLFSQARDLKTNRIWVVGNVSHHTTLTDALAACRAQVKTWIHDGATLLGDDPVVDRDAFMNGLRQRQADARIQ